jgi:hypothetical protein
MLLLATFFVASFQFADAQTTVDTSCVIEGPFIRCPADDSVSFDDVENLLDASISCPLDSVAQSKFIKGSQLGLCTCDVDIYDEESGVSPPVQTPLGRDQMAQVEEKR